MSLPFPLDVAQRDGFAVFDGGPRDLNLVAIRSSGSRPGSGDDELYAWWRERVDGAWHGRRWQCETQPGPEYLRTPINPKGAAILKPGQYRRAWSRGLHRGRPALVQVRDVAVYRDPDRDLRPEIEADSTIDIGMFGINIHDVARWGDLAGCIGLRSQDMAELLALYDQSARLYGPGVSLTLLQG